MKYPRIAAALYTSPWQILPAKFQEIAAAFEQARRHPSATPEPGSGTADVSSASSPSTINSQPSTSSTTPVGPTWTDEDTGRTYRIHPQIQALGPIALATVKGVLGRKLSLLSMQCGGFDTDLFQQQLANVRDDATIRTLVIDFDSPGGLAAGNTETANAIRAVAASGKNVIAYASGDCCSAAYFLASACDEIHAHPAVSIGSISTIWAGVDSSRQWEMDGLELKLFATGKFKATGYPGKKWTPEEEANCWSIVQPLDDEFKGYVRARRALSDDLMQGQWWTAKHAPSGVLDSTTFLTLDSLLEAASQL